MSTNLKLFNLMSKLGDDELTRFEEYLNTRYAAEGNALRVFGYYRPFFPDKADPVKMDLGIAYREVFRKEIKDELKDKKKLWNAFSKLYLWLKDFLVWEKLQEDTFLSEKLWLEVLAEKGLSTEIAKAAPRWYEAHTPAVLDSLKSCLRTVESSFFYQKLMVQEHLRKDDAEIVNCITRLKESASLIVLRMQCDGLNFKRLLSLEGHQASDSAPLRALYEAILQLVSHEEESAYFKVEALLKEFSPLIHSDEQMIILRYLQNFAAKMVRENDDQAWGKRLHEIHKVFLAKGMFLSRGSLSGGNFQNIVTVACTAPDLDWARAFLEEYSGFLTPKSRPDHLLIANATIAFEAGEFDKVIELTKAAKCKEEALFIRSKALYLRALYEKELDVSVAGESFSTYLERHRQPPSAIKEAAIAFMAVFMQLTEGKMSKSDLQKALDANPRLYFRSWLKGKIEGYRGGFYGGGK